MLFLHDSLNSKKFENDKKLNLLKRGIITPAQFVNLIEPLDGYIVFGPAILDKTKIKDFIIEWKAHQLNINSPIKDKINSLTTDNIINKFNDITKVYPEVTNIINEYYQQIKYSTCQKCTKNHYITAIVSIISKLKENGDNRDLGNMTEFIDIFLNKYNGILTKNSGINSFDDYDIEWINPEQLIGIGNDLINNLESCLECSIKHIGRAKILFEEFNLGYAEHKDIMFTEIGKGNKVIEEWYMKYLDSCAELDMGSSELIGNLFEIDKNILVEVIELANEIRQQRLLFQEDITKIPNFDELRLKIKKLEIKLKNTTKNNK